MTTTTLRWLHLVAYAFFAASLVPIAIALYQYLQSRRGKYYVSREKARRRAGRWGLAGLALDVIAIAFLIVSTHPSLVFPSPTSTPMPTITPSPVFSPMPSPSPRPTQTPTATPTRRPTATAPPIPTPTPTVRLPESAVSPLPSAVPAGEDASIKLTALAMGKDEQELPVDPADTFPPGLHRIYAFFQYEGMENGVQTTFAWYQDGEFFERCSDTWLWGEVAGRDWGESGRMTYYCYPAIGWEPGQYEVRVFIEDRLQDIAEFEVVEDG